MTNPSYIAKISDIMSRPQITQLTDSHRRILSKVSELLTRDGAASVSELVLALGLAGASSIMPTLKIMQRNGFMRLLGGGVRGKRITLALTPKGEKSVGNAGTPVLGPITAGLLAEAIQDCEETVDLGTAVSHLPGDFLLVVTGDSMIGDGILPGDRVLLRPDTKVENGEIAAVHYGDLYLATLKHVCFEEGKETVTLRASNERYKDVTVSGRELQIAGVFRGLIRPV